MKKKNLLVVCAAAGLCIICVLLLTGSMGIYAEKAGTGEFEPEMTESETSDTLTQILMENSETNDVKVEGTIPEETLQEIWANMYAEYDSSGGIPEEISDEEDEAQGDEESIEMSLETEAETGAAVAEAGGQFITLNAAELGVHEAGLILLKEINRLYPKDSLEDLEIESIRLLCDVGTNGQGYISWEGRLENEYKGNDANSKSYQFEIDAVTGKIISFGKFHPYQKDKDYSDISWTDDEIIVYAKEMIDKYDLAEGEELDWDNVELFNGTEDLPSLKKELEGEPDLSVAIGNTLIFKKDGKKQFYLSLDWETGEIGDYIWPGRSMPE